MPRVLLLAAVVAVTVGGALVLVGGWRTGVSWDETYHVLRMRNYLEHGWYLLDGDLLGSEPGPWEEQQYVYGPVTMLLLHGWVHLWGVDGAAAVPATAEAYAVRHLAVGIIGFVGVAAAAGLTRVLLRRWSWALLTAGVLLALPVWTGHAMFNVKDVPVATGYTLVTLGLALLVTRGAAHRAAWRAGGGAVAVTTGAVLAVGTRPGIWPGIALSVVLALAVLLLARDWRRCGALVGALAAAYGVLLAAYPAAFSVPVQALVGGALESSRYGGTKGHWWYLPLFLVVEIPTGYLLLGLLATAVLAAAGWRRVRAGGLDTLAGAAVGRWRRRRSLRSPPASQAPPAPAATRRRSTTEGRATTVALLVGLQCYALPALAVLRQSNLYTGVRQLLFAAPVLAVLVTVAVAWLVARRDRWAPGVHRLVPAVLAAAVALPLVAQLQLFPYVYAYSSIPANLAAPAVPRLTGYEVPTDYWRTSVRELAPAIPAGGWVTCSPHADPQGRYVRYSRESHENCATHLVGPLAAYNGLRSGSWDPAPTRFLTVVTGTERIGSNCTKRAEVRRTLHWRRVLMGYVAECELVLVEYPAGGLDFDGGGEGGKNLLGGWHVHASEPGIGVRDLLAEIGFWLPDRDQTEPLALTGTATGASGMRLTVNGTPARLRVEHGDGDARFRAVVPASVAAAYGEERIVVGFRDDDPGDGTLRLLGLRVEGQS